MLEYQREVDGNQARYRRNVTEGQLATTAEYALNVFNLQQHTKLEIQHLKHRVGQLQATNADLTEQMEAVQDQNADLQNTVAELDNQLQQILLSDEINLQLEINADEE